MHLRSWPGSPRLLPVQAQLLRREDWHVPVRWVNVQAVRVYLAVELSAAPDGRRRRVRLGGYATRAAAQAALGRLGNPGGKASIPGPCRSLPRTATGSRPRHGTGTFSPARAAVLNPGYLTRRFARLVRREGLPPIRLHDLRHGAATLALAGGADLAA